MPSTAPALLCVDHLHVRLARRQGPPAHVLRGVSLRLEAGQTLGLVGESGSGKTLLALAIMGLLPQGAQTEGRLHLQGHDWLAMPETQRCQWRGRILAMVFQEPMTALNPLHGVGHQVAEGLRLHRGLDAAAARAQALRLLDEVGLPQARERFAALPHTFSGGQRQRIVLAMALACDPLLLLADEPTTALDGATQHRMMELLQRLVRERGMALLLVSHHLAMVAQCVQRMAIMYAGSIIEIAATQHVLHTPLHPYTRALLAARPTLPAQEEGAPFRPGNTLRPRLATIPGAVPAPHALGLGCAFAPRCAHAMPACTTDQPHLEARGHTEHQAACLRQKEWV